MGTVSIPFSLQSSYIESGAKSLSPFQLNGKQKYLPIEGPFDRKNRNQSRNFYARGYNKLGSYSDTPSIISIYGENLNGGDGYSLPLANDILQQFLDESPEQIDYVQMLPKHEYEKLQHDRNNP